MRTYRFRVLNVFAQTTLGGNPLAVFENGQGLSDAEMQALALQFNLSETTFILPATAPGANARVRIFTPTFEMPFAGHPTLGTAHVVRALGLGDHVLNLEMKAGLIPVTGVNGDSDTWTLRANAPTHRKPEATRAEIASALSINENDIAGEPLWVNTGSDQLVVPLISPEAVARCAANAELMAKHCGNGERAMVYVFSPAGPPRNGVQEAHVRFFFPKNGAPCEDPGTGSACANLGGYLLANGAGLPQRWQLSQGTAIGKPCQLHLHVNSQREIFVSGRVIELGHGEIRLSE